MKITKMQGLGNDYLYFHEEVPADVSDLSILLSDRHYGVGSDGLIYLQKGALAVFSEEGQKEVSLLHEVYRRNAKTFRQALDEAHLAYAGGKNSPYIWMKCPSGSGSWETFDILLKQAQIAATPGASFGESGEGWIRFSMFAREEDVEEAGRRIVRLKNEKIFLKKIIDNLHRILYYNHC